MVKEKRWNMVLLVIVSEILRQEKVGMSKAGSTFANRVGDACVKVGEDTRGGVVRVVSGWSLA